MPWRTFRLQAPLREPRSAGLRPGKGSDKAGAADKLGGTGAHGDIQIGYREGKLKATGVDTSRLDRGAVGTQRILRCLPASTEPAGEDQVAPIDPAHHASVRR